MKRRCSDEQIIGMINEYEAGVKAQELYRKYGISDATFYKYKAKFGGMNVSHAQTSRAVLVVQQRPMRRRERPSCRCRCRRLPRQGLVLRASVNPP